MKTQIFTSLWHTKISSRYIIMWQPRKWPVIKWLISYGPYKMVNILQKIWPLERFEISVCGVPFTIHLKDVDYTKNGKRWSQVMYMNYLVKYKINVLKAEKISAYRKGDKKGLTILRSHFTLNLPPTYPLLTLNLPSIRKQLLTYSF